MAPRIGIWPARLPAPRIWNEQLIRYAGYEQPDGGVLGDPRYRAFTSELIRRGWRPPERTGALDGLPLVVETVEEGPRMFPLPGQAVHEVPLEHPELTWFADLGMRWHAVPVISNDRLEIGGVSYPAGSCRRCPARRPRSSTTSRTRCRTSSPTTTHPAGRSKAVPPPSAQSIAQRNYPAGHGPRRGPWLRSAPGGAARTRQARPRWLPRDPRR
ncbi:nitric oxide synthase oxygenase [Kribbella sp. NBC_00359]|uniref:nitric oxide synthase oxygenase n=1 Tax=Kribbella sp. NBC_00359 TaxID=2975966 RepID=UPI003FA5D014